MDAAPPRALTPAEAHTHNDRAPISRVPRDALEGVLVDLVISSPIAVAWRTALRFASVCRSWRGIMLGAGRVWARLSTSMPMELLWRMLIQSGRAPLFFQANTRDLRAMELVLLHLRRIQELSLSVEGIVSFGCRRYVPDLRRLELDLTTAPIMHDAAIFRGWIVPGLTSLSLTHVNLAQNRCLLSPTITTLKLRNVGYDGAGNISRATFFLQSIASLPALTDLCLELSIPSDIVFEQAPVWLVALCTLELVDSPELCAWFLQRVRAPMLVSLAMDLSARLPDADDGTLSEFAHALRRALSRSGTGARQVTTVRAASFDVAQDRLFSTCQPREPAGAETRDDPTVRITFHRDDKLRDALRLAAHSPFPNVTSLRLMPRYTDMDTVECWHRLSDVFSCVQELILGQTSYHSASMFLGVKNCAKGCPLFPNLRALALLDIPHHKYGIGEVGDGLARCLELRAQMAKPVQTIMLRRCAFVTMRNIRQIRVHVSNTDWDGEATTSDG